MVNINFSKKAEMDLIEIKDAIFQVSKDEKTAKDIIIEILDDIKRLEMFPEIGERYENEEGNLLYRYIKTKNYYSFYKYDMRNSKIEIYRVLYAKRNFEWILK